MNPTTFITFIGGGSLAAMLATQLLKRALSGLNERYGALATQAVLLAVSALIAVVMTASTLLPPVWVETTIFIFGGAMAIYEVLYKAIWQGVVKGNL